MRRYTAVIWWVAGEIEKQTAVLGRSLALFNGIKLSRGIIGFAVTGYILQHFGTAVIFFIGATFSLLAGLILIVLRSPEEQKTATVNQEFDRRTAHKEK